MSSRCRIKVKYQKKMKMDTIDKLIVSFLVSLFIGVVFGFVVAIFVTLWIFIVIKCTQLIREKKL